MYYCNTAFSTSVVDKCWLCHSMKACAPIIGSSRFAGAKICRASVFGVAEKASGLPMKILLVDIDERILLIPVIRWVMYRTILSVRMQPCIPSVVNIYGHHSMRGYSPIVLCSNNLNVPSRFAIVQSTDSVGFQGFLPSKHLLL